MELILDKEQIQLSNIDVLLESEEGKPALQKPNVIAAIRKISTNKDIRIFLTSLCKYSKSDWASLIRTFRILYQVIQSSILIKEDSALLEEIVRTPHIAVFFRRLTEEDVD